MVLVPGESFSETPCRASLPARPARDLPEDHCILAGLRYTHLPQKHRADITLPLLCGSKSAARRASSEAACGGRRQKRGNGSRPAANWAVGASAAAGANLRDGCYGDYCNAQICYPASLQDVESSADPWMVQARELCRRPVRLSYDGGSASSASAPKLLQPEELVACLSSQAKDGNSSAQASTGATGPGRPTRPCAQSGRIAASWLLEARSCQSVCRWLAASGWSMNPGDASRMVEAARCLREDEANGGGPNMDHLSTPQDGISAGLRYRLQSVPVCGNCLCIYNVIHSVVTAVYRQRKHVRAERQLRERREHEEETRREEMDWWVNSERNPDQVVQAFNVRSKRGTPHRSLIMDSEEEDWMQRELTMDDSSPALKRSSRCNTKGRSPRSLGHGRVGRSWSQGAMATAVR